MLISKNKPINITNIFINLLTNHYLQMLVICYNSNVNKIQSEENSLYKIF
jgi:hypothetical protein